MADTSLRYLVLLGLLPKQRPGIGTYEIQQQLKKKGYQVTQRTIQRDLEKLSSDFPIAADPKGNKNLWRYADNAKPVVLPNIDDYSAVTLKLVQKDMHQQMPQNIYSFLQPYFPVADQLMKQHKGVYKNWADKFQVLAPSFSLPQPHIKSGISEELTQAVLGSLQCEIRYQASEAQSTKKYLIHPLAMVTKEPVTYLLAVFDGQSEIRQLPLHRIRSVKPQARVAEAPEQFNLQNYIQEGHFGIVSDKTEMSLHLRVSSSVSKMLTDSPLSDDQQVVTTDDYTSEIKATVRSSEDLKRWLMGWGDEIQVLAPLSLRQAMIASTRNLMASYLEEEGAEEPA